MGPTGPDNQIGNKKMNFENMTSMQKKKARALLKAQARVNENGRDEASEKRWDDVRSLLVLMSKDANVCSSIDMEVGALGLLMYMNEERVAYNHRNQPFGEDWIADLKRAAMKLVDAVESGRTSTAIQTELIKVLKVLYEAELAQDQANLPAQIEMLKAQYGAANVVTLDEPVSFQDYLRNPASCCGSGPQAKQSPH